MAFDRIVPRNWRPTVTVALHKGKGKKTEWKVFRGISLVRGAGKIYVGVLVNGGERVTESLRDY